jgi:mycothione reductase
MPVEPQVEKSRAAAPKARDFSASVVFPTRPQAVHPPAGSLVGVSTHDLLIIGAGSGNSILTPDFDDRKVALVEEGPLGGTCLNRGCIPSKMFVYPADVALHARLGPELGVRTSFESADWRSIRDRIFGRIDAIAEAGLEYRIGQDHVDVYRSRGRFTGHKELTVGEETITADTIVLAAGAHVTIPAIPGLDSVDYHTSDTIMRIDELPSRLVIIGGGYIAAEMGHVFDAFGSRVTMLVRGTRMLKEEDEEISKRATAAYAERMDVRLSTRIRSVSQADGVIAVDTADGSVEADMLLVAVGRTPNGASLGVDRTGVELDGAGYVVVDEFGRTGVEGIWALGDISSPEQLKHKANADARIVAHNIAHPDDMTSLDLGPVPHAIFGYPQIASIGATEREVIASGQPYVQVVREYAGAAYGWAMMDETSVAKLIAHAETRELLGAHIIGSQASTLIQQLIQGARFGQTVDEMARGQWYIHPALPEVIEQALLEL